MPGNLLATVYCTIPLSQPTGFIVVNASVILITIKVTP